MPKWARIARNTVITTAAIATVAGTTVALAGILAGAARVEDTGFMVALPAGAIGIIAMLAEPLALMLLDK